MTEPSMSPEETRALRFLRSLDASRVDMVAHAADVAGLMTEREVESRNGTVWDAAMDQARAESRAEVLAEVMAKLGSLQTHNDAEWVYRIQKELLVRAIATVREMGDK